MENLKRAGGNWVTGDRFFDREDDVALLTGRIEEGTQTLLVAQRRMGKTSLLREVARRLDDRFTCLYLDFQRDGSPPEAIVTLSLAVHPHKGLWSRAKEVFENALSAVTGSVDKVSIGDLGVTLRAGLNAGNWAAKGDRLLSILAASEQPVVLLMDELPILVLRMLKGEDRQSTPEGIAQTGEFMSWLRKNSQEHQGKIRFILSGSIGLEPILRQVNLSPTINNFQPFELPPWSPEIASRCLQALANEYGVVFAEGVTELMVRMLGCCIPHHVQMFFSHTYDRCFRSGKKEVSADLVKRVFERDMLSTRGHAELTTYEERLESTLGDELLPVALDMLTEAAVVGRLDGAALKALAREYPFQHTGGVRRHEEILWVLQHDGYLRSGEDGFEFVSNLLRRWWKSRHGVYFTSISERGI